MCWCPRVDLTVERESEEVVLACCHRREGLVLDAGQCDGVPLLPVATRSVRVSEADTSLAILEVAPRAQASVIVEDSTCSICEAIRVARYFSTGPSFPSIGLIPLPVGERPSTGAKLK